MTSPEGVQAVPRVVVQGVSRAVGESDLDVTVTEGSGVAGVPHDGDRLAGEHVLPDLYEACRHVVARRREDRVAGVVRVRPAMAGDVHPVLEPGGRHELHPADRPGRGHVQVTPVIGLDRVDRGEDLPRHVVAVTGGLVDRNQERRRLIGRADQRRQPADLRRGEGSRLKFPVSIANTEGSDTPAEAVVGSATSRCRADLSLRDVPTPRCCPRAP